MILIITIYSQSIMILHILYLLPIMTPQRGLLRPPIVIG